MKREPALLLVRFVLAAGAVAASGCLASGDRDVLAIERTKTYHTHACPPVHMAKTVSMTAARADALHFIPCPVCKPNLR